MNRSLNCLFSDDDKVGCVLLHEDKDFLMNFLPDHSDRVLFKISLNSQHR